MLGCLLARWSKKILSARSRSWLRITVCNEVMSTVKISSFWPGKLKWQKVLSALLVSLIYDGSDLTKGDIIWSNYCEISSVGQL